MSALWTPGRAGASPGFSVAQPGACTTGPPAPLPDRRLCGARWSWFDAGSAPSRPESVYSTRVGIH